MNWKFRIEVIATMKYLKDLELTIDFSSKKRIKA